MINFLVVLKRVNRPSLTLKERAMSAKLPVNFFPTARFNQLPAIEDVEPIGERDQACLREIYSILLKHDNLNRFGISLLHKHFDLKDGECLVEVTDQDGRTSEVRVGSIAKITGDDPEADRAPIQTVIAFDPNSDEKVYSVTLLSCLIACWIHGGPHGPHQPHY